MLLANAQPRPPAIAHKRPYIAPARVCEVPKLSHETRVTLWRLIGFEGTIPKRIIPLLGELFPQLIPHIICCLLVIVPATNFKDLAHELGTSFIRNRKAHFHLSNP